MATAPITIYGDTRWSGQHGIGRFAAQVLRRCPEIVPLDLPGHPAAPLDALLLTRTLGRLPRGSVFFSPGYNPPLAARQPFVITVHDLNHLDRSENRSLAKLLWYRCVLRRACRRAAAVLTVSEFSRRRIVEWAAVPPARVVNVGNGVGAAFQPGASGQTGGYLLCVGNRKGHKNELRVVESFARALPTSSLRLRFTGDASAPLLARAVRCGVGSRVEFTGPVPDDQMPALYRDAVALVFPSLYEGFGLPVVESMACGTPVITSNTTALPEIAGGAALLVDPASVLAIAAAIARLTGDSALRRSLRRRGLERAARFTWDNTAAAVRRVLQGVAAEAQGSQYANAGAEIAGPPAPPLDGTVYE